MTDCNGSKPPVLVMGKRSVARRQTGRISPMTEVPHTAAIRANAGRRTQQPLRGSQCKYTRRRRSAPSLKKGQPASHAANPQSICATARSTGTGPASLQSPWRGSCPPGWRMPLADVSRTNAAPPEERIPTRRTPLGAGVAVRSWP